MNTDTKTISPDIQSVSTYRCPQCGKTIPFPFDGNRLYCPECHHTEPLYDFPLSYLYHQHLTEYNAGPSGDYHDS